MDVVAFVRNPEHVCARYRIAQYEKHLAHHGLRLILEPWAKGTFARAQQLARPRKNQIVFLQRKLLPWWQFMLLRRSAGLLVYDFDDAVHRRDSSYVHGPFSLTRNVRFHATVAKADLVIAGNAFLADAARSCTAAEKIEVVPTAIDPTKYPPATHKEDGPTRLAWIGSSGTLALLEECRPLLESIGREIPGTVLRVICNRFPKFESLPVEETPWSEKSEGVSLGESDIGISLMSDTVWSRGKCGLKILQYMAAALPVVASPIGVHPELVGPRHGFLPKTTRDWIETLKQLATDPRLRRQMGFEGRRRVETHFHVDTWGPVLAGRLAEAASRL